MSKQKIDGNESGDDTADMDEAVLPPTYIVLQISQKVPKETLTWLVNKIRGRRRDGGGELILMKQPGPPEDVGISIGNFL